jgi:hypothetical protein
MTGLDLYFPREWAEIVVSLGQALASGAHPRRILIGSSPAPYQKEKKKAIPTG